MAATSGASTLAGASAASAGDANAALSIQALRAAAARDPKAAIRETAKQFEALFMQQLMKSMREATVSSGMQMAANSSNTPPRIRTGMIHLRAPRI